MKNADDNPDVLEVMFGSGNGAELDSTYNIPKIMYYFIILISEIKP